MTCSILNFISSLLLFFYSQQRKVERDLYRQEGCSPYKAGILPWVQLPLWITLSYALRDMTGVFPNKLPLNPEATLSFASEGALWFQNLTLPDPYYVLPVVLVCTNLLNIEVCLYSTYPYFIMLLVDTVKFI